MINQSESLFSKDALERYSEILIWAVETARQKTFAPEDSILIQGGLLGMPLIKSIHKILLIKKMNPIVKIQVPSDLEQDFYEYANDHQLAYIPFGEETLMNCIQGSINVRAPDALTHLSHIDGDKLNIVTRKRSILKRIMVLRQRKKECSWTLTSFPTAARAENTNMTLQTYADKVKQACFLDHPQALSMWKDIYEQILDTRQWLTALNISHLHIESKEMDLRLSPGENRKWLGLSGRNIPSFEIFTSPDWRTVEGTYFSNQLAYVNGNKVKNIRLSFSKGNIQKAEAEIGNRFLQKSLETDVGASRVGEFSLTDKRFSKIDTYMADILYDENYGGKDGNCHIALGNAFENAYNGNIADLSAEKKAVLGLNSSALHWDIINTEPKTVTAILPSGKKQVIYENGIFLK